MAIGTRAGMWDPWNDGTAALSLRAAPGTCPPSGHGPFSHLLLLFLQAQWYHFYLQDPQRAVSHPGESGSAVEARVEAWVWAA